MLCVWFLFLLPGGTQVCGNNIIQVCGNNRIQVCGNNIIQVCGNNIIQVCGNNISWRLFCIHGTRAERRLACSIFETNTFKTYVNINALTCTCIEDHHRKDAVGFWMYFWLYTQNSLSLSLHIYIYIYIYAYIYIHTQMHVYKQSNSPSTNATCT